MLKRLLFLVARRTGLALLRGDDELSEDMTTVNLSDVKRLASPRLLEIPGVSGVGLRGDRLTVYLDSDSRRLRKQVQAIVKSISPSAEVTFLVTGPFRAQPA